MATRKHKASASAALPDRFHVGQTCALSLSASTEYADRNGTLVVVVTPRRFGQWQCARPGSSRPSEIQPVWRYQVRAPWGLWNVEESMLRAVYDGEALSTWDELERATGLRLGSQLGAEGARS